MALLDADMMVYRIGFSCEDEDEKIAKARLTEWLTDIVYMDLKCEDYIGFISGKTNFRDSIAKTHGYKANRLGAKKPKHYEALREHLQRMGLEVTDGEEADDAVAIKAFTGHYWIVHQDKDLDQIPGYHYNPVKCIKEVINPWQALKNFYAQILSGDDIDNVKGLWRIGYTKAHAILKDCESEKDLYKVTQEAYVKNYKKYPDKFPGEDPLERVLENARLLWLRREPNQMWEPPK